MYFHKPIDQVTEADLRLLEEQGISENRQLDFKLTLPQLSDKGKHEFTKDITAFANTVGGTLLYGVDEGEHGEAVIKGVECGDIEGFTRQLSNIIQGNTDPQLHGYQIKAIHLENGKVVIGIDVPKSWNGPHAVKVKNGSYKFYTRVNTENVMLDVHGIRNQMLASETLRDQIKNFLTERLIALANGETPSPIYHSSKVIFHLIPVTAFQQPEQVDMREVKKDARSCLPIFNESASNYRFNLDGLLGYYNSPHNSEGAYVQSYRNGIIETVETSLVNNEVSNEWSGSKKVIPCQVLFDAFTDSLTQYLEFYRKNQIHGPIYGFITLQDVKGNCIPSQRGFGSDRFGAPFDRHTIQLPEMMIEDLNTPAKELLKVPMDALWNASGFQECPY